MVKLFTLTCPSCNAKLDVTNDVTRLVCTHCGNEHLVVRSENSIALKPLVEQLNLVQTGVDKTASELAIQRLSSEINELGKRRKSLTGKKPPHWLIRLSFVFAFLIFMIMIVVGSEALIKLSFVASFVVEGLVFLIGFFLPLLLYRWIKSTIYASKIKELDNIISLKLAELHKHRSIVRL